MEEEKWSQPEERQKLKAPIEILHIIMNVGTGRGGGSVSEECKWRREDGGASVDN